MANALPATGAWRPGLPIGRRQLATVLDAQPLALEAGTTLGPVTVAYETWGTLAPDASNAVLVEHALTGDSHLSGEREPGHVTSGWWDELVGPGRPLDTNRFFVVCPNVLGGCQGTTGPSSLAGDGRPFGSRFPAITIRDQVAAEVALAELLGIGRWTGVVGGSMGAMRVLEWAIAFPERVERAVIVAVGAAATAEQIALCSVQCRAIRADPAWRDGDYYDAADGDGPHRGLSIARGIGQISYRTDEELDERFGHDPQGDEEPLDGGRYAVESYLEHHGEKIAARFDANTYLTLSEAMSHHDVGRGRGGVERALSRIRAATTVVGISSDRLYPLRLQRQLADLIPTCGDLEVIESPHGHDGFLIESVAVGRLVERALAPPLGP